MSTRQRNTTQRLSAAPEWNSHGNIYELPANAVAGTAESLLDALRDEATAKGNVLEEANIAGILISTQHGGNANCHLRTGDTGSGAADAGAGIGIVSDSTLYLPFPHFMTADLLYESTQPIYVAVFY